MAVLSLKSPPSRTQHRADILRNAYHSTLQAIGSAAVKAIPGLPIDLESRLLPLREALTESASPDSVAENARHAECAMVEWSRAANTHFDRQTTEVKDLVRIMAGSAESLGRRDEKYTASMAAFTGKLETIATLDDLSRMRASLLASAVELKTHADQMEQEGRASLLSLKAEVSAYEERLATATRLAFRDPLTGLANRRGIEDHLSRRIASGTLFTLIWLDLNKFKAINDTHGHGAGDEILALFAAELQSHFRAEDGLGRWGGDEFAVIMECRLNQARAHVEKVSQWLFGEYRLKCGTRLRLTAAVGIAAWDGFEPAELLIERADREMYRLKKR